jgi:NAD(P)-dependent dehydrogenase (short-subunit alcohol dehydrogenase family)
MSPIALIVGATRGLGAALVHEYLAKGFTVYGTTRSISNNATSNVHWIPDVDISKEDAGRIIVSGYNNTASAAIDILIITAGYFGTESFDAPNFEEEVIMYKTSAIGPVFVVQQLYKAGLLHGESKIVLVSSESGSIALRHASEGGGNYGHHASKAALNMVGKLLSLDLKEAGVAVAIVHPGFMRTEMTRSVGYDEFWEKGGAVTPEEAAQSLAAWVDTFTIDMTGTYWAPRGPG